MGDFTDRVNTARHDQGRDVIDSEGFRANVGIILANKDLQVLWAKRIGQSIWQFPQGGIHSGETPTEAMYRELYEEIGLQADDVQILACTVGWLKYRLPRRLIRKNSRPLCIGQKQKWFLLQLLTDDSRLSLGLSARPEFDQWMWVNYWFPLRQIVAFKREVYRQAMTDLYGRVSGNRPT